MNDAKRKTGLVVLPALDNAPPSAALTLTPLTLDPPLPAELHVLRADGAPAALVELARFTQPRGSWLLAPVDESVAPSLVRDGNLTLVTRVDPLFALLALLTGARAAGDPARHHPLSSVAVLADGTDLRALLADGAPRALCAVQHALGDAFYRLDDARVTAWLLAKVDALLARDGQAGEPAARLSRADAVDLVAHYLPAAWAAALAAQTAELKAPASEAERASAKAAAAQEDAAELAMQIMADEARASNDARDAMAGAGAPQAKKRGRPAKKKVASKAAPDASAVKFWATRSRKKQERGTGRGTGR